MLRRLRRRLRRRRRPRRLFWRIYRYGLLLLITTTLAAVAVSHAFEESPWSRMREHLDDYVADDLERTPTDRLQTRIHSLHELLAMDLLLVRATSGERIAEATRDVTPPVPDDLAALSRTDTRHDEGVSYMLVPLTLSDGTPAVLLLAWDSRAGFLRFLAILLAILLVAALILYPLARSIARPLERVSAAAEAIAEGDLSARSGVCDTRDEVGVLATRFDAMAERIEHLIRSEKELLANISHELRTPLARTALALELAEEEADPDALHEHLHGIALDHRELTQLVEEVLVAARLDLAQGDALTSVLRLQPIPASRLLHRSISRFTERHPEHTLDPHIPDDLPQLEADPELLRRVFDNLLDNAAKYGASPIAFDATKADEHLIVSVRDHGTGLPDDELERIFDPFYRADKSRTTQGLGLGLTLCQRIVSAHHGAIHAEHPAEGEGLRVVVSLPLAERSG